MVSNLLIGLTSLLIKLLGCFLATSFKAAILVLINAWEVYSFVLFFKLFNSVLTSSSVLKKLESLLPPSPWTYQPYSIFSIVALSNFLEEFISDVIFDLILKIEQ